MNVPSLLSRRTRVAARKLLFVPVLAAGLTAVPASSGANEPTAQGVYSSEGQAVLDTPAEPVANGRPVGVQTGRRPR